MTTNSYWKHSVSGLVAALFIGMPMIGNAKIDLKQDLPEEQQCSPQDIAQVIAETANSSEKKRSEAAQAMTAVNDCSLQTIIETVVDFARQTDKATFVAVIGEYVSLSQVNHPVIANEVVGLMRDPNFFGWFFGAPLEEDEFLRSVGLRQLFPLTPTEPGPVDPGPVDPPTSPTGNS